MGSPQSSWWLRYCFLCLKLVFVSKSFPLYTFIGCHVVSWKWTVIERMVFFLGVRYGPYRISPVSTQFTLRIMFGQFLLIQASGTCTGAALGYWKGAWANLALAIWYSWKPHELEPLLCAASNRHGHTVRDSVEHTHSILANARKWDWRKLNSRSRWRSTKISSKLKTVPVQPLRQLCIIIIIIKRFLTALAWA